MNQTIAQAGLLASLVSAPSLPQARSGVVAENCLKRQQGYSSGDYSGFSPDSLLKQAPLQHLLPMRCKDRRALWIWKGVFCRSSREVIDSVGAAMGNRIARVHNLRSSCSRQTTCPSGALPMNSCPWVFSCCLLPWPLYGCTAPKNANSGRPEASEFLIARKITLAFGRKITDSIHPCNRIDYPCKLAA